MVLNNTPPTSTARPSSSDSNPLSPSTRDRVPLSFVLAVGSSENPAPFRYFPGQHVKEWGSVTYAVPCENHAVVICSALRFPLTIGHLSYSQSAKSPAV